MLSINFPRSRIGAANSNPIGMMPARSLSTCSIVPLRCSRSWRVHRGRGACCTATFIITTSSTISTAAGSPSIPRAWSARAPMRLAPRCEIRPRILPVLPWRQSSSGGSPSWASACNSIATASWHGRLHKPFCRRFGAFKTVAIRAAAWQLLTPFFPCCSRFLPRTLSVAAGPPYVVAEQIERNAWITTGTMTPTSAASSIP